MKRVCSFLILAALIAATAGCVGAECGLTVAATSGGSVVTPGDGTSVYYVGEAVSLVATPHAGYRFVNWTGDVDAIADVHAASTTVIMNDSYRITANFEEIPAVQFELTVSSTAGGSVTTPGEGTFTYDEGEVASLVAQGREGYLFVNWTGDVDNVADIEAPSTTITMNGNYSIGAHFQVIPPQHHSLVVSSTDGGAVVTPGEGTFTYDDGQEATLATEAEEGYRFVSWTGDVEEVADVDAPSTTITMNGDRSIAANFEPIPPPGYDLTIATSGGGCVITPGTGTFAYDAGTAVTLSALPASGYRFVNWTGDVDTVLDVSSALTTVTVNGDYSLVANFQQVTVTLYYLTITSTTGGSVTSPGEGTYACTAGTVAGLVATPASGHQFVNWTGDVANIANVESASTTIAVYGHSSIRANFEQVSPGQFSLTTSSTTGGSVTAPGEGTLTYDDGAVVSLTATAASGYHFVNWTGDVGTIDDANASSTTIVMNSNCSVRANFSADSSSPPGIGYTEAEAEALIIVLVNDERQQFDLSPLTEDALLTSLAREHSISMVENGFFGHERYPGERSLSYDQPPGTIRGENLAMIPTRRTIPGPYLSLQEVCEWAVSAWMGSSGHRSNILEPRYTKTGVGVAFSAGGDYLYITQIFEGAY